MHLFEEHKKDKKQQLKFQEVKKLRLFKFFVLRKADHKIEGLESKKH